MPHEFEFKTEGWATGGIKAAPSDNLKNAGFTPGMVPPAYVFNYQWDLWGKAIAELQEYASSIIDTTKSVSETLTITPDSWVNGVYTYRNDAITATSPVELLPNEGIMTEQLKALQKANIVGGTQTKGSIQLVCKGTVPAIGLPVRFIIRKDM